MSCPSSSLGHQGLAWHTQLGEPAVSGQVEECMNCWWSQLGGHTGPAPLVHPSLSHVTSRFRQIRTSLASGSLSHAVVVGRASPAWVSGGHCSRSRKKWSVNYMHFHYLSFAPTFSRPGIYPLPQPLHLLKFSSSFKAEFKCWFLHKAPPFPVSLSVTFSVFLWHLLSSRMVFLSALSYH